MRIRKRQVPFPLSSLSPDPTVQLPFGHNPPPILSDDDDTAAYYNAPSSPLRQFHPIQLAPPQTDANLLQKDERSNDASVNCSARGAKTDTLVNPEQPPQGKCYKGEEAFLTLKKRRESSSNEKMKMKKKNGEENSEGESKNGKKRGKRGGGLMEGSRCSRVNGRGWRCWQQTLVGYSLCEHHLGKGRLRSMASVRSRSKAAAFDGPLVDHKQEKAESCSEDLDDESGKSNRTLKRKLGIVKARSMSSLLGQHNSN